MAVSEGFLHLVVTDRKMAANITTVYKMNRKIMLIQIFVVLFLCINLLLIMTFFTKEFFYTTMRYILFAVTLMSDCLFLVLTDLLVILSYSRYTIQTWLCLIIYILSSLYTYGDSGHSDGDDPGALRGHLPAAASRRAVLPTQRSAQHPHHPQPQLSAQHGCLSPSSLHLPPIGSYTQSRMCSAEIFIVHKPGRVTSGQL